MYEPRPVPQAASGELRTFLDEELASIALVLNNLNPPGTIGSGIPVGRDFGWHDIIGEPQYPTTGSGKPAFSQIGATGISAWNFGTGDEQFYVWHIPHDYVPGSDIFFHVHWFGPQTAGGFVRWHVDYIYAKGHDQEAYGSHTSVFIQAQQSTTAFQQMISETTAVTIAGLEPDGVIIGRIQRIAPVGETDISGGVFAPILDVHYQSTNVATPNKVPNFYNTRPGVT